MPRTTSPMPSSPDATPPGTRPLTAWRRAARAALWGGWAVAFTALGAVGSVLVPRPDGSRVACGPADQATDPACAARWALDPAVRRLAGALGVEAVPVGVALGTPLMQRLHPGAAGYYATTDRVYVQEPLGDRALGVDVLTHELTHALQARDGARLRRAWDAAGVLGQADTSSYAAVSRAEHMAEAMSLAARGLEWIQAGATGRDPAAAEILRATGGVEPLVAHWDTVIPGTRVLLRMLIATAPYAGHPLAVAARGGADPRDVLALGDLRHLTPRSPAWGPPAVAGGQAVGGQAVEGQAVEGQAVEGQASGSRPSGDGPTGGTPAATAGAGPAHPGLLARYLGMRAVGGTEPAAGPESMDRAPNLRPGTGAGVVPALGSRANAAPPPTPGTVLYNGRHLPTGFIGVLGALRTSAMTPGTAPQGRGR